MVPSRTHLHGQSEPLKSRKRSLDPNYEPTDPEFDLNDSSLAQKVAQMEDMAMEDVPSIEPPPPFDPIKDELPYAQFLNRVLPPDIRILAWCPTPPANFSARFSCKERRYRYFFTQPAFAPVPNSSSSREGWLDIDAMREAARHYVGLHDFRNFCKLDPSKQITNFERRIFRAEIEELDPLREPVGFVSSDPARLGFPASLLQRSSSESSGSSSSSSSSQTMARVPKVYAFNVDGSAFLWHQVRHLVAVLFLVGQGLEKPSVVADMLDVTKTPTKPLYDMASDAPLVLWDCIFPAEGAEGSQENALEWIYAGDTLGTPGSARDGVGDVKFGRGGVVDDLWQIWRARKIDEVLAGTLIDVVASQGRKPSDSINRQDVRSKSTRVFDGGDTPRAVGTYVPLLERRRMENFEVVNARYAAKKGLDKTETIAAGDDAN